MCQLQPSKEQNYWTCPQNPLPMKIRDFYKQILRISFFYQTSSFYNIPVRMTNVYMQKINSSKKRLFRKWSIRTGSERGEARGGLMTDPHIIWSFLYVLPYASPYVRVHVATREEKIQLKKSIFFLQLQKRNIYFVLMGGG